MKYSDLDILVDHKSKLEKLLKLKTDINNNYKTVNLVIEGEEISLHRSAYTGMAIRLSIIDALDKQIDLLKSKMMLLGVDDFNQ